MSGGTFMYAHRHVGAEDQAPHYLVVMLDLFSMVVESAQLQQLVGPCGLGKASLAFLTSVILPAERPVRVLKTLPRADAHQGLRPLYIIPAVCFPGSSHKAA